jgi:para-nitrobenzyl esterase
MKVLGCKTVADLQKVDVDKIVDATQVLALHIWAERDGRNLPLDPYDAYARGAAKDIDFMQGCTKDEWGYFIYCMGDAGPAFEAERYANKLAQMTDEERASAESYCKRLPATPEYSAIARFIDQFVFIAPLFRMSEAQTAAGGKSYTYFFRVESAIPLIRSGHAVELNTVFNHPELKDAAGRAFDETFSRTMRRMWVKFAKTGNPSLTAKESPDGKAKVWPLYDTKNKEVMVFDEFNIHTEKESDLKIVEWNLLNTLTNYYCI